MSRRCGDGPRARCDARCLRFATTRPGGGCGGDCGRVVPEADSQLMTQQHIPGLAAALVDGDRALWVEGFGYRDRRGGAPVNTIFSVQSMSKLFTATAVMQAVGVGRVDLDAPITTYLPSSPCTARSRSTPNGRSPSGYFTGTWRTTQLARRWVVQPGAASAVLIRQRRVVLRRPQGCVVLAQSDDVVPRRR